MGTIIYENGIYLKENGNDFNTLVGLVDYKVNKLNIHPNTKRIELTFNGFDGKGYNYELCKSYLPIEMEIPESVESVVIFKIKIEEIVIPETVKTCGVFARQVLYMGTQDIFTALCKIEKLICPNIDIKEMNQRHIYNAVCGFSSFYIEGLTGAYKYKDNYIEMIKSEKYMLIEKAFEDDNNDIFKMMRQEGLLDYKTIHNALLVYDYLYSHGSDSEKLLLEYQKEEKEPKNDISYLFEYRYNKKFKGIELTKYIGIDKKILIPSEIEGIEVVAIGPSCFSYDKSSHLYEKLLVRRIEEVILPDTIQYICQKAFSESGIEKIVIPDKVKEIKQSAFAYCYYLKEVVLSKNLETISSYAFQYCSKLETIFLPNSLRKIGLFSFSSSGLKEIVFNEGLLEVGKAAFQYCDKLKKVVFSSTVNKLSELAFAACEDLETIEMDCNIEKIEKDTFYRCRSLRDIKIPKSVTSINHEAFYYCKDITINIPMFGKLKLEKNALSYCYNYKIKKYM